MQTSLRRWVIIVVVLCGLVPASLASQDGTPGDAPPPSGVTMGEGAVDVDERPSDEQIRARLEEILSATGGYEGLRIEVRSSVVFVSGTAETEALRDLATNLAERVNGVAAVINTLELPSDPIWSLKPARDELDTLLRQGIRATPLLAVGVVVLIAFTLIGRFLSRWLATALAGRSASELLVNVIRKGLSLAIFLIGLYLALRITGLTRIALTVVSGTGLIGLALGFAFRDIAENFLASILLSIQRPFQLGDVVEVDSHTGIVRKVTARGTLLIDFDGNHIQIANATVYKNTIKNFSANPNMRITFTVGIGYEDQITSAQSVIRGVLEGHEAVLKDPEPLVLVDQLGASTINLKVYFWIDSSTHSTLKLKSSVIRLSVRALTAAGISMPDESREVIFPQGVPVRMLDGTTERPSAPTTQEPISPVVVPPEGEECASIAVEAEGDLTTETQDLNRQADESRDPEGGANVLPRR